MVAVSGADQREVALIGDGEENPLVGQLKEIGIVMVEQTRHDDVRSAHESDPVAARHGG